MLAALQFGQIGTAQIFVDLPQLTLGRVQLHDSRFDIGPSQSPTRFKPVPAGDKGSGYDVGTAPRALPSPVETEIGVWSPSCLMLCISSTTTSSRSARRRGPTIISEIGTRTSFTFPFRDSVDGFGPG